MQRKPAGCNRGRRAPAGLGSGTERGDAAAPRDGPTHDFLRSHPVLARKAGFVYLARQFRRRHPTASILALFTVLSILASLIVMGRQYRQALIERDRTRQVTGFIIDLFGSVDPAREQAPLQSSLEMLDRAAANLEGDLDMDPLLRAKAPHTQVEMTDQSLVWW